MKKILLVEDEEVLIRMYEEKFERAGFNVVVARTAVEGVKMAKKEKPDLIVLDIILPSENGVFFLEQIEEEKELKKIPVIVFSNYDNPEVAAAARRFGVKEYVIKANHDPEEIIQKIRGYFDTEK